MRAKFQEADWVWTLAQSDPVVRGQSSQYKGAFHVFNSAVFLPESKHVYARIDQMFDRLQSEVVP